MKEETKMQRKFKVGDVVYQKGAPSQHLTIQVIDSRYWTDKGWFEFADEDDFELVPSSYNIEKGRWYVCLATTKVPAPIIFMRGKIYYAVEDNMLAKDLLDDISFVYDCSGLKDNFRPWSLYDAKVGDFLVNDSGTIIMLAGTISSDTIDSFCSLDKTEGFMTGIRFRREGLCPAMRSQMTQLVNAYLGKGYVYDSKTKKFGKKQRIIYDVYENDGDEYDITIAGLTSDEQKIIVSILATWNKTCEL